MTKYKYSIGGFAILTIFSLMLSQAVSLQTISDTSVSRPDLILFSRRDSEFSAGTYVLDVTTREVTRLAPTWYIPTSWSPDGRRILGYHPDINPFIATTLFAADADGQNRQVLTDNTQLYAYPGQWSPDSRRIIFWAHDLHVVKGQPSWAIYDVPANGGPTRRLTEPTELSGGLAISPDGSQIAFTQDGVLYTMSTEEGKPRALDVPLWIGILTWSPDGTWLAALASNSEKRLGIYVIAPDGSNVRLLVTDMGAMNGLKVNPLPLNWSPDSSELLFLANVDGGYVSSLGIVNVETNVVTTHGVGQGVLESLNAITAAVWSADGTRIVISGRYRDNNPYNTLTSLYLVDHDLTRIRRLTGPQTADIVVQWRPQTR